MFHQHPPSHPWTSQPITATNHHPHFSNKQSHHPHFLPSYTHTQTCIHTHTHTYPPWLLTLRGVLHWCWAYMSQSPWGRLSHWPADRRVGYHRGPDWCWEPETTRSPYWAELSELWRSVGLPPLRRPCHLLPQMDMLAKRRGYNNQLSAKYSQLTPQSSPIRASSGVPIVNSKTYLLWRLF